MTKYLILLPLAAALTAGCVDSSHTWYLDADNDGFGTLSESITSAEQPSGYVRPSTDCDDSDPNNFPGNPEVADGLDNNCDGVADDGLVPDADGDGYLADEDDCNDSDAAINPGQEEILDLKDNNCDGIIDNIN